MSFAFLEVFDEMANTVSGKNSSTSTTSASCPEPINRQDFFLFMLIPASVCTVILMFTKTRKSVRLDCCSGRPGLVFPQDMMGRSNRFSQAAAFGCIASIAYEVIFYSRYAFTYSGPLYLKVFVALTSMLIYGIDYYPLFASLSLDNLVGYVIGTLYAWTLGVVQFYKTFKCDHLTPVTVGLIIAHSAPQLLCHLYLCFSLPTRLIICIVKRNDRTEKTVEDYLQNSYSGTHVSNLFLRPESPPPEPSSVAEKMLSFVKALAKKIIYSRVKNFRYSGRVLSVMTVAFILMYMVTVEIMVLVIPLFRIFEMMLDEGWTSLGSEPTEGEEDVVTQARTGLALMYYILIAVRACFLTSISVAFFINCFAILHSLSTYRTNLLSLYRGNPNYLTTKDEKSNGSLLVGSMRYAGYQVAYVGWGYLVQFLVMFLVSVVIALVIILIQLQIVDQWFLDKLGAVWPVLVTTLIINIMQLLMAKFAFLQHNGRDLAINNRRLFFIVVYFLFFYNIFLGLVSCLLRILKAIITGALLLPRLDHSTLPRRFQFLDPGFDAYCGFMHVECAHTHPVAITFIKLLQVEVYGKDGKIAAKESADKYIAMEANDEKSTEEVCRRRRHRQVIFKWKLVYTLLRNPELIIRRKTELLKAIELLGMENLAMQKDTIQTTKC